MVLYLVTTARSLPPSEKPRGFVDKKTPGCSLSKKKPPNFEPTTSMTEASPFLQKLVRLHAYIDLGQTVAQYYREARTLHERHLLLFQGYAIFRDRWPTSDYPATQVFLIPDLMMTKLINTFYTSFMIWYMRNLLAFVPYISAPTGTGAKRSI